MVITEKQLRELLDDLEVAKQHNESLETSDKPEVVKAYWIGRLDGLRRAKQAIGVDSEAE